MRPALLAGAGVALLLVLLAQRRRRQRQRLEAQAQNQADSQDKAAEDKATAAAAAAAIQGWAACMRGKLKTVGNGYQPAETILVQKRGGVLRIDDCGGWAQRNESMARLLRAAGLQHMRSLCADCTQM